MDRTLVEASNDLFAPPGRTFLQVTLPQLAPAIVAGFLLSFTLSFDDFIVAFFVAGPSTTLPMYVFASIRRGVTPEINAIASTMLFVTVLSILAAQSILKRTRRPVGGVPPADGMPVLPASAAATAVVEEVSRV